MARLMFEGAKPNAHVTRARWAAAFGRSSRPPGRPRALARTAALCLGVGSNGSPEGPGLRLGYGYGITR